MNIRFIISVPPGTPHAWTPTARRLGTLAALWPIICSVVVGFVVVGAGVMTLAHGIIWMYVGGFYAWATSKSADWVQRRLAAMVLRLLVRAGRRELAKRERFGLQVEWIVGRRANIVRTRDQEE